MKKSLSILLMLILTLSAFFNLIVTANAETSDSFSYNILSDGNAEITGYTGSMTNLTIPAELDGHTVTSIGEDAFFRCDNLTGITIPDSVTSIGDYAFMNCWGLTTITIPDSVTSMGEDAFAYCTGLTSINISDGVTSIGNSAFYGCASLMSVTIPVSVTKIEGEAFGFYHDEDYNKLKVDGFTIYGYPGTEAERYAIENGFTFIALDNAPEPKAGDADGDGELSVIDVTYIQRYCAFMDTGIDEETLMNADIDKNGLLEIIDATFIQRHLAGIEIPYEIG